MLRVFADGATMCDGTTRREVLRLGGLTALSLVGGRNLNLPTAAQAAGHNHFGQARSVVFVCLYGGPPHTETFDMKPDGPTEARGPFVPIPTSVSGIDVCEHLPRLSKIARLYALVRSLTHEDTGHASALYTHLTGWPHPRPNRGGLPGPADYPHYGSVMGYLKPPARPVPPCVIVGGRILPQFNGIGQTGGFLGAGHAPYVTPKGDKFINHYGTLLSAAHGPDLALRPDISPPRLDGRRQLLDQLNSHARLLERRSRRSSLSLLQQRAFEMLSSPDLAPAFDLEGEPARVRDAYGRFPLGQNLLLARRLVEVGVPAVQVSDIPPGREQHWDLHYANIFDRLKSGLLPRMDHGVAAFLTDLERRGLLEKTLVIVGGEFGRTPWMDKTDGGRQHWPRCYSMLLAGAGIRGGQVFGASDKSAAYPAKDPVGPWDLGATLLHCAGIDVDTKIRDPQQNRAKRICRGEVIQGLF